MRTALPRSLHLALSWLLAVLLPAQGIVATVLLAMGPSHVHPPPAATAHVLSAFGHFDVAQRHHHGFGDAGVVHRDDAALAAEQHPISPSLAAFVALPQPSAAEPAVAPRGVWVPHRSWAWRTHDPGVAERPPSAA
ncbi:MAG TPA: hypothetical protein VGP22_08865 [Albitalea sp.]|nr:hypothetical protein [Albitalea sp.]